MRSAAGIPLLDPSGELLSPSRVTSIKKFYERLKQHYNIFIRRAQTSGWEKHKLRSQRGKAMTSKTAIIIGGGIGGLGTACLLAKGGYDVRL